MNIKLKLYVYHHISYIMIKEETVQIYLKISLILTIIIINI